MVFLAESVPSVRGSSQEQTRLGIILCSGPFDFGKKRFDFMKRKKDLKLKKDKPRLGIIPCSGPFDFRGRFKG